MEAAFFCFLVLHIATGATALLAGLVSMRSAKGKTVHRLAGKIFFWAMLGVFVSSVYMSLVKSNWFLFCVGVFSFYLTGSGYLVLKIKNQRKLLGIKTPYLLVCVGGLLAGVAMLVLAAFLFMRGTLFGIVPGAFGFISLTLSFVDYRLMSGRSNITQAWLRNHGLRMAGAFGATVTAFVVVNIQVEQQWVLWLLPTIVIIPLTRTMLANFERKPITRLPL